MIDRPFSRWPAWQHTAFVCVLCLAGLLLARAMLAQQPGQTQRMQLAIGQVHSRFPAGEAPLGDIQPVPAVTDPELWLLRSEVDEVLRQVGEAAQVHGVALRTLSVSYQAASTQTWGRVTLDVSVSGSYAALKAWQAAMQQRFSALSMQSLRMQGNPLSAGTVDAQLIWVLHVRD